MEVICDSTINLEMLTELRNRAQVREWSRLSKSFHI